jgi:hypothetical protein
MRANAMLNSRNTRVKQIATALDQLLWWEHNSEEMLEKCWTSWMISIGYGTRTSGKESAFPKFMPRIFR